MHSDVRINKNVSFSQVVGVLALFVWPAPMTLKQIYLTITVSEIRAHIRCYLAVSSNNLV